MDRAIIAAAGWKGGGKNIGFQGIPIPFIPLCDTTTTVSRLSRQLSDLGYDVTICVGQLGYPFCAYQPRYGYFEQWHEGKTIEQILSEIGVNPDSSPWTEDLIAYAQTLGTVMQMPDPGWANPHDTFCQAIDEVSAFENLVLVQGDTLLSTEFLTQILNFLPSFQFVLCPNHSIFKLNGNGREVYRKFAEPNRKRAKTPDEWDTTTSAYPDGSHGANDIAIGNRGWHTPPWKHVDRDPLWMDIDHGLGYRAANERIQKGWYK